MKRFNYYIGILVVLLSVVGCTSDKTHKEVLIDKFLNNKLAVDSIDGYKYYKTDSSYVFVTMLSPIEDSIHFLRDMEVDVSHIDGATERTVKWGALLYEVVEKENGIGVYSFQPLCECGLAFNYEEPVYNKIRGMFLNRCNRGIDFQQKLADKRYYYYAGWDNWEKGRIQSAELFAIPYVHEDSMFLYSSMSVGSVCFRPEKAKLYLIQ